MQLAFGQVPSREAIITANYLLSKILCAVYIFIPTTKVRSDVELR